jgi:multiple sugar transport system substrate-binding protein
MKFKAVVLFVLLIAGLGLTPTLAQDKVKIDVWFHAGEVGEGETLKGQLDKFNASQDKYAATLTEIPAKANSYNDAVAAASVSGTLPCLLDLDGPNLYNYAWAGYIIPLDKYVSKDFLADYLPSLIAQGTYDGKLYALGQLDSGLGLVSRKSVLEAAGVRIPKGIDDAWTLDEFNDALSKLQTAKGVKYALDMKMNYGVGEWYTYAFSPVVESFGGDLIDRSTYQSAEGVLNGEKSVAALTWIKSLFDKGYATLTPPDDNEFVNGNAALGWLGHWMYPAYKKAFGDDLVVLPMPKFGEKAVTGMGSWAWAITSTCKDPDGAWAALNFILQPENIKEFTDADGAVPGRLSVLKQSATYGEGGDLYILAQQLEKGVALPRPITPAYPTITVAFYTAMDNIIKGGDPQTELDKAVDTIDKNIKDNSGYPIKK